MGMPSRRASSSIRVSTASRLGTSSSRCGCSSSVISTVLMAVPQELLQERLERYDVSAQARNGPVENIFVQRGGGRRFVESRPATIPGLELGPWQGGLDLDHATTKEPEGSLVLGGGRFEMQPDFQPSGAGVMPRLVVEGRLAEVDLHQPAPAANGAEALKGCRQIGFQLLAQSGEKVGRRHH